MVAVLRVVNTVQDAYDMVAWLSETNPKMLAIDTETTGLNVRDRDFKVRLVQVGTRDTAWVIPFEPWQGLVHELVDKFTGRWAMWNARYDVSALASHGVMMPWSQIDDCMIACRLAEPNESAALKNAAVRHVASGAAMAQTDLNEAMRKNNWDWATVPIDFEPYVRYAAMDVILTSREWEHEVIQKGMASPVYGLEMETLVICKQMSDRGMRIDYDYCRDEAAKLRTRTLELADDVANRYGVKISSAQELTRFMLERSAPVTDTTASGAPSMAKDQLKKLIAWGEHPEVVDLAEKVLLYRKCDKLAGSYLESFIELADDDHLLHADIQTLAARTGRMSIQRPGLQTLPKPSDDPMSTLVRKAVIPRQDGEVLISADWAQIEMRLMAHESGDERLISAFKTADETGGDFFVEMGKIIWSDPGFTKADKRRKTVKNCLYGMAYGAGAAKLAVTAGIPIDEATNVRASILGAFPGLNRAMSKLEREARDYGSVTTYFGRELHIDDGKSYTGLNSYIQGTAADCMKRALVFAAHAGLDDYMVVPVHDEIVVSVPEDQADDARHELLRAMQIDEFAVSIPAEASPNLARWGDDG